MDYKRRKTKNEKNHRGSRSDGAAGESRSKAAATAIGIGPGEADGAMNDRRAVRVDEGSAVEEPERSEGREVRRILGEVVDVSLRHLAALKKESVESQ